MCLMVTFDVAFFSAHYFKNPEKSCNFRSQVSTYITLFCFISKNYNRNFMIFFFRFLEQCNNFFHLW